MLFLLFWVQFWLLWAAGIHSTKPDQALAEPATGGHCFGIWVEREEASEVRVLSKHCDDCEIVTRANSKGKSLSYT